ncbi:hypothetical protein [Nocardia heshunensis]
MVGSFAGTARHHAGVCLRRYGPDGVLSLGIPHDFTGSVRAADQVSQLVHDSVFHEISITIEGIGRRDSAAQVWQAGRA